MEQSQFYRQLVKRYRNNTASPEEVEVFFALLKEGVLSEYIDSSMQEFAETIGDEAPIRVDARSVPIFKRSWIKYAAAIIILVGIGALVYLDNQKTTPAVTQTNPAPVHNDVAPGGNKATLTLADGSKIVLDSAADGLIAAQGDVKIQKDDAKIIYPSLTEENAGPTQPVTFNTLSTPRGGQYQLMLPDGSQVWLNAESSITYPTAFTERERERRVSITGEAYFEVAKDKKKPFIVSISKNIGFRSLREGSGVGSKPLEDSSDLEIEVLGTHFNVNSYREGPTINTTLLEGSVRISLRALRSALSNAVHTSIILKPGQQGQLSDRGLSLAANPDLDQVMAWKNGMFNFKSANLHTVMQQLARWYDLQVTYTGEIPDRTFSGEIDRNLSLTQVLNGLTQARIKYTINGNKINIHP